MTPRLEVYRGGVPVITFQEHLAVGSGTARVYSSGANDWLPLGAPGSCSESRDWWPRLGFDRSGRIYRASYEYALQPSGNGLNLRTFDRPTRTWRRVGPFPLSTGEAHMPDVEIAPNGDVLVSYQDGPIGNAPTEPQGAVSVQRIDPLTGIASYVGVPGFSDQFVAVGRSSSWATNLEIGPSGELWAAWNESNAGSGSSARAAVARFDDAAGAWQLVGGFGLGHDAPGAHLQMVLDGAGTPYVASLHYGTQATIGIQVFQLDTSGTGWSPLGQAAGLADFVSVSPEAGYRESYAFALSASGVPHVAYRGRNQQNKVCVRRFREATESWEAVGALAFSPGTGIASEDDYMSIAFRGEFPLVAFRHGCSDPSVCAQSELMVWSYY